MRASGHCVFTSGRTPLAATRKRSHTASFTLSAAKLSEFSGLCCAVTSILMLSLGVNQRSHATSLAARYRSCSLRYSVNDSNTSTRWAKRLYRLSNIACDHEVRTATPPRCLVAQPGGRPVIRSTSGSRSSSTPAAQGKNNCNWFTSFS